MKDGHRIGFKPVDRSNTANLALKKRNGDIGDGTGQY